MRLDAQRELLGLERFDQVVVRAGLEPDALVHDVALDRQEHDGHLAPFVADGPANLEPVRVGQHDVENEEVRALGTQHGKPFLTAPGAAIRVPVALGYLADEHLQALIVVDQHDLRHSSSPSVPPSAGSTTRNTLPSPTLLSSDTAPPSMAARSFTSESPRPLPP